MIRKMKPVDENVHQQQFLPHRICCPLRDPLRAVNEAMQVTTVIVPQQLWNPSRRFEHFEQMTHNLRRAVDCKQNLVKAYDNP